MANIDGPVEPIMDSMESTGASEIAPNFCHNLIPGAALQLGIPDLLLALSPFVLAFVSGLGIQVLLRFTQRLGCAAVGPEYVGQHLHATNQASVHRNG